MEMGLVGLLPLIPLTKNGKEYIATEKMIETIVAEQPGLLEWAKIFAGLVFKDQADHEWLERKFAMYNDIINESWVIQEAVQKGRREELNRLILKFVQGRYPEIMDLTQKQIGRITEIEPLENLLDTIIRAQSIQEVLQGFITLDQH